MPVSAVPVLVQRRFTGNGGQENGLAQAAPSLITQLGFEPNWPMTWVDVLNGRAGNEPAIFFSFFLKLLVGCRCSSVLPRYHVSILFKVCAVGVDARLMSLGKVLCNLSCCKKQVANL